MRICIAVFGEKLGILYESKEFVCEIMEFAYKKVIFLHGSRAFERDSIGFCEIIRYTDV